MTAPGRQETAGDDSLRATGFDLNPDPALMLDGAGALIAVNEAAERLFGQSLGLLRKRTFASGFPADCGLIALIARCREAGWAVRRRAVDVQVLGHSSFLADAVATPAGEGKVLLSLRPRDAAQSGERAVEGAVGHAVAGLGQMLAHEIKNPLAGIRGAAQLLMGGAAREDAPLAQLIIDETDRIRRLVDRMEVLADEAPPVSAPVNIHRILDRVRAIAATGIADGLSLREAYDPSLPLAWGEEDQLIQLFLNLAKNAAEAAHAREDGRGEITVSTAWRHGVRVRTGDGRSSHGAPLEIKVMDNGPGVPGRLRDHLFEPFVTTKRQGGGLGLAVAAKIVAGHGGHIDFESEAGRTTFRVLLPVAPETALRESAF